MGSGGWEASCGGLGVLVRGMRVLSGWRGVCVLRLGRGEEDEGRWGRGGTYLWQRPLVIG